MACGKEWTTKEIAILRQIHQSGISLDEQMGLLPGRSIASAKQTMRAQRWGRKPRDKSTVKGPFTKKSIAKDSFTKKKGKKNFTRFLEVVAEFGPITIEEVSQRLSLCRSSAHAICKFAHRGGPEKLIYIADYTEAGVETKYARRKWSIGNLPDVESNSLTARQRRQIAKEEAALEFERMKERDFAPRRDPLIAAFFGSPA